MSDLSDWKEHVHKPMIDGLEKEISALKSSNAALRKGLEHATVYMNAVPPPPELRVPMQLRVEAVAQALAT
jgi:hypothetical protein